MSFDALNPFDPFGDFAGQGYLRNNAKSTDPDEVTALEHYTFMAHLDHAFEYLKDRSKITYQDVLKTHEILFLDFYPWAGQDRLVLAPTVAVGKGTLYFAHPKDIKRGVDFALGQGQAKATMVRKPGEVLGTLTFAHPFLEGNGRALLTVHTVLAERAGFGVDWSRSEKAAYLDALTLEIENPGKGHLDAYLKPLICEPLGYANLSAHVTRIEGLRA